MKLKNQIQERIYLDNNATTPCDPEVAKYFFEILTNTFGNPSSTHRDGQLAKALLLQSKEQIATFLNVKPQEIIFTSSGTEGMNLLLRGTFGFHPKGHIITSDVEHPCVYKTVQELEKAGCSVTYLSAGLHGGILTSQVEEAIRPDTRLIALMHANNETGVITDIDSIGLLADSLKIPFIVDAVASFGKIPCRPSTGITAMCFSGHKICAPKGAAFIFFRKGSKISPLFTGGNQESGLRAGTENLAGICALSKAIDLALVKERFAYHQTLLSRFEKNLFSSLDGIFINGTGLRVSNTVNICFEGLSGDELFMYLDLHGVRASLGSACHSGSREPSRVLLQMGLSQRQALSSLRFSFSRFNTLEEVDRASQHIVDFVKQNR